MTLLKVLTHIGGQAAEEAGDALAADVWECFNGCFADMYQVAVQNHLMDREHFDEIMANEAIDKLVSLDDAGRVVGLTTATTDLDTVGLINPGFFRHRYRKLYDDQRIVYVPFIGVLPHAGVGPLFQVVEYVYNKAWTKRGAIVFDVCTHNNEVLRFTRRLVLAGTMIARGVGGPTPIHTTLDQQSYELVDLSGELR